MKKLLLLLMLVAASTMAAPKGLKVFHKDGTSSVTPLSTIDSVTFVDLAEYIQISKVAPVALSVGAGETTTFSLSIDATVDLSTAVVSYAVENLNGLNSSANFELLHDQLSGKSITAECDIEALQTTTAGLYYITITIEAGALTTSKTIPLTVTAGKLTATEIKLYNPYGKDTYNSAYSFSEAVAIASMGQDNSGKMTYAAQDSVLADIAVDNNLNIRATHIVAELTSINGGLFALATAEQFDNATTSSLQAIGQQKNYIDNEAIMFEVGTVYAMKLANNSGTVILKITEINPTDTASSANNTGYVGLSYKFAPALPIIR